jgi:hypothetical protein
MRQKAFGFWLSTLGLITGTRSNPPCLAFTDGAEAGWISNNAGRAKSRKTMAESRLSHQG